MSNLDMTQHNLIEPVVHTTSEAMVDIFQMPVSSTMVQKLITPHLGMVKGKLIIVLMDMVHITLDMTPKATRRSINKRELLLGSMDKVLQDKGQTQLEMISKSFGNINMLIIDLGGGYPDRPGNPVSQYANPTHHVAGFQQGSSSNYGYDALQANQSPYVTSQADTRSTQGYSMYLNTDAQRLPHGIHQEKHSRVQPTTSFENHSNSAPHQGGIYYQPLPSNPSNDGSPSEVSNEVSRIHKGTVEELEKLCEDGNIKEALEVLALLQGNGTVLHAHQYFRLMQTCGDATALEEARVIHSQILESSVVVDTDVQNKILEMYAKCGSMEDAKNLFSTMDRRSLDSWNTMISGFVHNGHGEEATDFFDQFKQTGDKPDAIMFTHIFLACGIMGSVDEGMLHFETMQKDFGISPTMEHYASIVSMLGQSGYIAEAHEFVERMPVEPSIEVWENLMNMCRLNGFLELGDRCAQIIEHLDSSRLNEQSKMGLFPVNASDLAKEKERKRASVAEARSKVHEYRAGDRSHPDTPESMKS
jgi:pentatricopeptide repeat protein